MGIALGLVWLYWRGFEFSPAAYGLMAVLLYLHTIGGHYTFERVPFDFVSQLFGFERNHFDSIAHFSVGFYAYAIAEALARKRAVPAARRSWGARATFGTRRRTCWPTRWARWRRRRCFSRGVTGVSACCQWTQA